MVLAGHVWKFLRMCLKAGSKAEKRFRSVQPELNCFEAWRVLCWDITQGRKLRLLTLREQVNSPPAIKSYAEISNIERIRHRVERVQGLWRSTAERL